MAAEDHIKESGMAMKIWDYNPNAVEPPDEFEPYECPVCGEPLWEGDEVYLNESREIIGCVHCVTTTYAENYFEDEL